MVDIKMLTRQKHSMSIGKHERTWQKPYRDLCRSWWRECCASFGVGGWLNLDGPLAMVSTAKSKKWLHNLFGTLSIGICIMFGSGMSVRDVFLLSALQISVCLLSALQISTQPQSGFVVLTFYKLSIFEIFITKLLVCVVPWPFFRSHDYNHYPQPPAKSG